MRFPKYLSKSNGIGVCAPSGGVTKEVDIVRFKNAAKKLKEKTYDVKFTDSVFKSDGLGRSADKEVRAKEFMSLIQDTNIDYIVSAKGGDFLAEMLPYLDFKIIGDNPKWIQGYSDNTSLLLSITTKCDIATVYGYNFGNYGMDMWHESVSGNLEILQNVKKIQNSFDYYENEFYDRETGLEGFKRDLPVQLKSGTGSEREVFEGRLIGGCMDVLLDIAGTKYEDVPGFVKKYGNDGIIWYIESFDAVTERVIIGFWKLKEMGWFENVKGFIIGRPCFYKTYSDMSYIDAVMTALKEFNVPVIFDCDVGHKEPQWTMINGAMARMEYNNGKGTLTYI